jgi:hypothetical protein
LSKFSHNIHEGSKLFMAKKEKEQIRNPKTINEHVVIPPKYQHAAALGILYLSLLVFFHSIVFDGKTYESPDSIASHSWETLSKDAQADGVFPLWNPYIFCGMPGYASLTLSGPRLYDLTTFIFGKLRSFIGYLFINPTAAPWLLFYLIYGVGVYFFAFHKFKNKPVSLIVSLMAMYATYVALLIMMGHMTKLAVLACLPFVLLLVDKLREKFNLLLAILLAIVVRLMIEPGHVQFIFYSYLALGTYLLFLLIRALIKKENWRGIIVSGTTLAIATVFAFFMGADQHLSTLEYNPYSIRGSNPITHASSTSQTKTIEGGLDYNYASDYSFSPGEILTFFVPSWYGFGPTAYQGELTQNQPTRFYLYLGDQPIVDGPQYMGIIVIILALIGFYRNRKEPFVQYMAIIISFSLLVSFGKEFSFVYDFMYRYFPMFNKFRAPVLILVLVQFFIPILAGYGILSFVNDRTTTMSPVQKKRWKYLLSGFALAFVATFIGSNIIKDIYSSFFPMKEVGNTLARSFGQLNPTVLTMLYDFIFSNIKAGILVGCVLLLVVFGAFYSFQTRKLTSAPLYSIVVLAVLFDLWRVAWKPHDPVTPQEAAQAIVEPDYVKVLEKDTTQFRVLKLVNGQLIYDNSLAYWRIQNAYGYQGAKLRIYQDMVDVAGIGNPLVWQLMNVKYLISNRNESDADLIPVYNSQEAKVYMFRSWMSRVFFVNRYEKSDGLGILTKIASISFNPRDVAYLLDTIKTPIDPPMPGAQATIVHNGIQDLEVQATATGNNLLFLSETYYPEGWKAYIDGKETDILRLDYLFRGVVVPAGSHVISMKFEPRGFYLGKQLSLWTNLLLYGGLGVIVAARRIKKKKEPST